MTRPALAIFAKTPGLSPVKTRLAAGIGADAATAIYLNCVAAVGELARSLRDVLDPCWAVAEAEGVGAPLYAGLPCIWTGPGDLGERLDQVHARLLQSHGAVVMIGTDSPQTPPALLARAAALARANQVVGPARDGGFWLYGGNRPVDRAAWTSVPWSAPDTLSRLLAALGPMAELPLLTDLDEAADLPHLAAEWTGAPAGPAGRRLRRLLRGHMT